MRRTKKYPLGINKRVKRISPRAGLMICSQVSLVRGEWATRATGWRWKFKILAWQETNRRWDGPIANSFRVENSSGASHPPRSIELLSIVAGAPPSSLHFCSFSSRFSSLVPPCSSPTAPLFSPLASTGCVGIQRPHNRLLVPSPVPVPVPVPFFHLFLVQHPSPSTLPPLLRLLPLTSS